MRTIYGKIQANGGYVWAEICYKKHCGSVGELEISISRKSFGLFLRDKPTKRNYENAVKWVNDFLEDAKRYSSDKVIDYRPED